MKITSSKILEFFIYLFPLAFQFANISNRSIYYYITYVSLALLFLFFERHHIFTKRILTMHVLIFAAQFLVPMLSGLFTLTTVFYCFFMLLLLFDSYIFGKVFNECKERNKMIRNLFIFNSIILVYEAINNIGAYNMVSFMTVFNNSRSNRAYFGFTHPNFAGAFMCAEVILGYIYAKSLTGKKKYLLFLFAAFWVFSICLTGSRTALYSIIIFFGNELIIFISKNCFSKLKNLAYVMFFLIAIILLWEILGTNLSTNYSGRASLLVKNFQTVAESGRLLFGSGGQPTSQAVEGIDHSDNWYMTTIINTGIIGLSLYMFFIISSFLSVIKKSRNIKNIPVISLILMISAYSLGENVLFIPGVELSWLVWSIIMAVYLSKEPLQTINSIQHQ